MLERSFGEHLCDRKGAKRIISALKDPLPSAKHQSVSETQSPSALGDRVRYLVLSEFHLEVLQSPAQGMKWNSIIHLRIQIVGLVVPDNYVAWPSQGSEHRIDKSAIKMAGESDLPGSSFAGKVSSHGMNGNRDGLHASRLAFQQGRFDRVVIRVKPAFDARRSG